MFGRVWRRGGESDQICAVFEDSSDDDETRARTSVGKRGKSGVGEVGGYRRRGDRGYRGRGGEQSV